MSTASSSTAQQRFVFSTLITAALVLSAGCRPEPLPPEFERNLVHTTKYQIKEGFDMTQASDDTAFVTDVLFGTPDEPKLPTYIFADEDEQKEINSVVSMENLIRASGSDKAEGRGLYQKHCVICHGTTGDGRGSSAAALTPYPRDYRRGTFKFTSTPRGSKPTRDDLARVIRDGIPAAGMPVVEELKNDDSAVQALVDYVIYLSWRGEVERLLVDDAIFELDLSEDRILDTEISAKMNRQSLAELEKEIEEWEDADEPEGKEPIDLDAFELWEEQWEIVEDYTIEIAEAWLEAEDDIVEVPEAPADIPVAENYDDVVKLSKGETADAFLASIKRGQELFVGKVASCSKCHGEKGLGDGQTTDYDDWTKDWTTNIGIKPDDHEALIPLFVRGALQPKNALPRNFSSGFFRGGQKSSDLYLRITQGIDGTPMPAATFVEGQFEEEDVWHIINFIRSLQTPPEPEEAAEPQPAKSEETAESTETDKA